MKASRHNEGETNNPSKNQNAVRQEQTLITCLKQSGIQGNKIENFSLTEKRIELSQQSFEKESGESSEVFYNKETTESKEGYQDIDQRKKVVINEVVEQPNQAHSGSEINQLDQAIKKRIQKMIITKKPNIRWEDVAGLEDAKKILIEQLLIPIRFKQIFAGSYKSSRAILLYGASGTGKTHLAKACATQIDAKFFSVSLCDFLNKQAEHKVKLIKALFDQATVRKPSIIFFDDLESIQGQSEQESHFLRIIITEIVIQIQKISHGSDVYFLANTNIPWKLDRRIWRSFQKKIYIPLPDMKARLEILKRQVKDISSGINTLVQENLEDFARQTEGYTGSDIVCLIRDAFFEPIRRLQLAKNFRLLENGKWTPCGRQQQGESKTWVDFKVPSEMQMGSITKMDCVNALKRSKPSVDYNQLLQFQQYTKIYNYEG